MRFLAVELAVYRELLDAMHDDEHLCVCARLEGSGHVLACAVAC